MTIGNTKAAWLHMLREGGRWRPLDLKDVAGENFGRVCTAMHESGSVKRFEPGVYGVTADCRVPTCVTLAELMEIGIVKGPNCQR
jgi:hypothetical protein